MKKALLCAVGACLAVIIVLAATAQDKDAGPAAKGVETGTAASAAAAEKKPQTSDGTKTTGEGTPSAQPEKKGLNSMAVDDIAERLSATLDMHDEVVNFIPGLKKDADPDGKEFYTYNGTRLESLEKDKLVGLYNRVIQETARISTERLTKQLELIQQGQQAAIAINQATRIPKPPQQPPQPPPQPQQMPPQPPKVPPAPPQIPRR